MPDHIPTSLPSPPLVRPDPSPAAVAPRRCRSRALGRAASALALALALGGWIPAAADPSKVFVFNDNKDRTNQFAKNYIWQDLGLLDANGKPGTIQANGDITLNGNKVGEVIKNAQGQVIGYKNADGSKEAYDVDKTTTDSAWMRVADNGCLVIMKHGGGRNGTTGGGIHLDNSQTYDGFGQGTQAGFRNNRTKQQSGPYPLTPRPGANIKLTLYVCNGGSDPDGGGPKKSVGESALGVPGIGMVESFPRKLAGTITPTFKQGDINQQRAALRALRKKAKEAGFGDAKTDLNDGALRSWMQSLPADDRYRIVNDCIASTGACIAFHYSTDPTVALMAADEVDAFQQVQQVDPGLPSTYTIDPAIPELSMQLVVEAGDLAAPELFQLDKLSPESDPPVGRWATAAFDLREMEYEPVTPGDLDYRLEYAGNPALARPMVYDFGSGVWVPVPTWSVSGGEVVFGIHGPRMVAVAEACRRVPVVAMTVPLGSLSDGGVWDPLDSDLDATLIASGLPRGPIPSPRSAGATLEVAYDCSAPGILLDVRGVVRVNTPVGLLLVQAWNPSTGTFETLASVPVIEPDTAFRLEDVPAGLYLDGARQLVLRYRTELSGPLARSELPTVVFPTCQVTIHD